MSTYSVTVNLDAATLSQLYASGYSLCCLLGAQVGDAGALPLLWSVNPGFVSHNVVNWPACSVFTAAAPAGSGQLAAGEVVTPGWTTAMSPGQLLTVPADGAGTVSNAGIADAFAVFNASATGQLCGLAAAGQPLCALPLPGQDGQVLGPLPHVVLFFANGKIPPVGTAIDRWPGGRTAALLVDASLGNNPTVSFNINTSWDYTQQAWGTPIPFTEALAPYLIAPQAALLQQRASLTQRLLLAS